MFSVIEVHIWSTLFTDIILTDILPPGKITVLHIIIGCVNVVLKMWPAGCPVHVKYWQTIMSQDIVNVTVRPYNTQGITRGHNWSSICKKKVFHLYLEFNDQYLVKWRKKILTKEAGIDVFVSLDHLSYRRANYFNYTKFVHAVLNATI